MGLAKAAELAARELDNRTGKVQELRDYFETEILKSIPSTHVNGSRDQRIPNTSNIRFENVESEGLVINLDLAGIACSTGSACTSGSIEPSHVLTALGLSHEQSFNSVRFSLSRYTTREEIDQVLEILPGTVRRLRQRSPTRLGSSVTVS